MKVLIAVALTALATAGVSFGAAKTVLAARSGDVVTTPGGVACYVSYDGLGCNARSHAKTTAVILSSGIVVVERGRVVFRRTFR